MTAQTQSKQYLNKELQPLVNFHLLPNLVRVGAGEGCCGLLLKSLSPRFLQQV